MACKIRLVEQKGCGVPPRFEAKSVIVANIPALISVADLTALCADTNAWIEREWTSWRNVGWFFLSCCLWRFVRNDMLLREPLRAFVRARTKELAERSGAAFEVHRKLKTYGYGETSRTVVKIAIVIVDEAFSPELFETDEAAERARARRERAATARATRRRRQTVGDRMEAVTGAPLQDVVVADGEGGMAVVGAVDADAGAKGKGEAADEATGELRSPSAAPLVVPFDEADDGDGDVAADDDTQ